MAPFSVSDSSCMPTKIVIYSTSLGHQKQEELCLINRLYMNKLPLIF